MASLGSSDFAHGKIASAGNYSGKTRDQIFELKINSANNNTFIIGANESGTKVIGVKYVTTPKREFTYVLPQNKAEKKKNDANNQITVSSLRVFKSPDFGGGARGSGGGTAETKITESLQCYYNSYIYNTSNGVRRGDKLLKTPPTDKELEATAKFCKTTHTL